MNAIAACLIHDESGFIVSAELVLIGTIAVLAMVVGLSEVALNINNELHDVAMAFGSVNQSFQANGMNSHGGGSRGSSFGDQADFCSGGGITSVSPNGGEQ
ncbi:MAG: branched-chain amino acid aminotransferase [Planctomycetes bacterium]|nr:branched-chain amino acid aminotransferase [Planctomycetota bacterium]